MQERYIVSRQKRFDLMVSIIRQTQKSVRCLVDLGCGAGSLTLAMLTAFPEAQVFGIDYDPTLLYLARERLAGFNGRVKLVEADLARNNWTEHVTTPVDGLVSAPSLHWLTADELTLLYNQLNGLLRPGGIFLNADHVGSNSVAIQKTWQEEKERHLSYRQFRTVMTGLVSGRISLAILNVIFKRFAEKLWANGAESKKECR